ncbi:hypothetical protein GW17_00004971 [Ensete ventricosum]|nr:hypothetical protein GW17_00004971 [Ensete ventricosum]RZS11079.1 hypothetical protein BHM03_00042375 [Ensete ventricosum]
MHLLVCNPSSGSPLRAGRWRPSLVGVPLAATPAGWSQPIAPVGGRPLQVVGSPLVGGPWLQPAAPAGGVGRGQPPPCRGPWPQSAAPTASPSSLFLLRTRRSYIPVFQIRMEKMKEVKRPPL